MTQITIDKNVPVPEIVRLGRPPIYPFAKMEVGDSFITNNKHVDKTVCLHKKYHPGTDFTTRRVEGGFRIWRIK